jgi:ammonium transporter, Amt family
MKPLIFSDFTAAVCLISILLMPCAACGLAMINAGMGRSRSAAHSLLGALSVVSLGAVVYFVLGSALQGYAGGPAHVLAAGGKFWDWAGAGPLLLRGIEFDGSAPALTVMFGLFAAGIAALIPMGAAAERLRLAAACVSTALFAGVVYPFYAHWAWGGGWLAQLGAAGHAGPGFIDSGGSGTIHLLGGLSALAITWILGPRLGKYHAGGMPAAIPAHNVAYVLLGCFLAWLGFLGIDCAGAILFTSIDVAHAGVIPVNATLASGAALLAAAAITNSRFGKTDASLCANAFVGGLVASAAGCAVMRPAGAFLVGAVAGALVVFSVELLEMRLKVDDPGGAVSVHAIGGAWGLLSVALFARGAAPDQWLAQITGIASLIGFGLPLIYSLNWLLNRLMPLRVLPENERQGLDLSELGAGAYPDFITHTDEY